MYSLLLALTLHTTATVPAQIIVPSPGAGAALGPPVFGGNVQALKPAVADDVVLRWNETVLNAIRAERTPPPMAARNLAIVHAAIYDAVNAIQRSHAAYYVHVNAQADTAPEVAAAVAAHRVLVTLYPKQVAQLDAALDQSLDRVPEGRAKSEGMRLGQYVAEQFLDWRSRDGATRQVAFAPPAGPGLWQPTPPDFRPALLPQWPTITCFCMRSGAQFRPSGPPALNSTAYRASYDAVMALGGIQSSIRTADQTEIARFWADDVGTATPPGHWNQVAQAAARTRGTSLAENARLFALLNLTLADAAILCWDCKYKYNVWRPIQAIRSTDDPAWTPLLTTPPFPAYTSGHSTFSGSAAAVLAQFFGADTVRFTVGSDGLRGVTRSYDRFSAAAEEAGRSRIYGGIHWEFDNADGLATGRALGEYVSRYFLVPQATVIRAEPPAGNFSK